MSLAGWGEDGVYIYFGAVAGGHGEGVFWGAVGESVFWWGCQLLAACSCWRGGGLGAGLLSMGF